MNIRPLLLVPALAFTLALPATSVADSAELGTPVVELMPQLKKLRDSLNLDAKQNEVIDSWLAEAPAKRKQLEQETLAIRAELREAILKPEIRIRREALKKDLAEKQTRLIEMRSLCTRMLRDTLSVEQFDKVVSAYRESISG